MDESAYGTRDKRGHYTPKDRLRTGPLFELPFSPKAVATWLFGWGGYLWPYNLFYALVGIAVWLWLTPPMAEMREFEFGWIAYIWLRNAAIILVYFGAFHLRLYVQKAQGTQFKFNPNWPSTSNDAFLFKNQNIDNMIWAFGSGVTIWTAYEALTWWMFANGYIPWVSWAEHPVYIVAFMLLIPLFREVHFYLVHRLIHVPVLYKYVHSLHHNNVNPGPWSGLAMHPVEHLLYFSGVILHWIVPSHPVHAMFHLVHLAMSPAPGHTGFEKVVAGEETALDTHCFAHYLHHKYFEVNYADGGVPLDRWFGTFHDGTKDAEARMNARFKERNARRAAKAAAKAATL